jgi:hypothetical protein
MSEKIDCWRCGRKNAVDDLVCGGCGIEEPQYRPSNNGARTSKVAGSSASEDAWSKFAERQSPLRASNNYSPRENITASFSGQGEQRQLAARLAFESSVATGIFYVAAALSTIFALGYYFFGILLSDADGWTKIGLFFLTLISILGAWLSIFLIVPFYTYMNLRAKEFQNR